MSLKSISIIVLYIKRFLLLSKKSINICLIFNKKDKYIYILSVRLYINNILNGYCTILFSPTKGGYILNCFFI